MVDGTYTMTRMEIAGPVSPGPLGPMIVEFSSGVMQTATLDPYSGSAQNATYWFRTMGTDFQLVPVCGSGGPVRSVPYSASATELSLMVADSTGLQQRAVFTRR